MKKLLSVAALAACASGCVWCHDAPITAGITLDAQHPDTNFIDNSVKPEKVGTATSSGIILFVKGDASLSAAMKNGNIKKVHHVDYKNSNVLGIWGERVTTVYGE